MEHEGILIFLAGFTIFEEAHMWIAFIDTIGMPSSCIWPVLCCFSW